MNSQFKSRIRLLSADGLALALATPADAEPANPYDFIDPDLRPALEHLGVGRGVGELGLSAGVAREVDAGGAGEVAALAADAGAGGEGVGVVLQGLAGGGLHVGEVHGDGSDETGGVQGVCQLHFRNAKHSFTVLSLLCDLVSPNTPLLCLFLGKRFLV